jgi:hypothetical protein
MIARLHESGKLPTIIVVQLTDLYSPKVEIISDQRYRNVLQSLATLQGRANVATYSPIDIQILGADSTQPPTIPLKDVQLLPEAP